MLHYVSLFSEGERESSISSRVLCNLHLRLSNSILETLIWILSLFFPLLFLFPFALFLYPSSFLLLSSFFTPLLTSLSLLQVRITELHPLTEELVQLCIDDRTIDFTLALMDFAQWDHARQKQKVTQAHKDSTTLPRNGGSVGTGTISGVEAAHTHADSAVDSSDNVVEEVPRYVWPEFVLTMLRRPTDWASWRKRVERSISAQKDIGKLHDISSKNRSFVDVDNFLTFCWKLAIQRESSNIIVGIFRRCLCPFCFMAYSEFSICLICWCLTS